MFQTSPCKEFLNDISYLLDYDYFVDDMKLNKIQYMSLFGIRNGNVYDSGIPKICMDYKWDNNEMPYEVDEETISSTVQVKVINNTIDKMNLMTCGCFKIRYVHILMMTFNKKLKTKYNEVCNFLHFQTGKAN